MGKKNQVPKQFQQWSNHVSELDYLLHLPTGYSPKKGARWPLILFLHGSGERGKNLARVARHGPPKLAKDNPQFPFVLVSPQCPSGQTWDDESLLGLVDEIAARHRIDESRIYLTGLSMGGYGVWSLGLKYPKRFAAIAPICGGGNVLSIVLATRINHTALQRLPVWAFHGARDELVPPGESERMVEALHHSGNKNARLTIYPESGHDSWTETYDNPELYQWFLQHRSKS